jgi:hypothetical protein
MYLLPYKRDPEGSQTQDLKPRKQLQQEQQVAPVPPQPRLLPPLLKPSSLQVSIAGISYEYSYFAKYQMIHTCYNYFEAITS